MIPPLPAARGPEQDGGTARVWLRYEDVAQDGRLQLNALMPGLGAAIWVSLLGKNPAMLALRSQGIIPILRRMVAVGEDRPVSINVPLHFKGSYRFAREKDGDRLFANMWLEALAPVATTFGPNPPADAPLVRVGRVFAEHVVTRPFAPPAERKVTSLDVPGLPAIPEDEHVFDPAEALIEGPALDDMGDIRFGHMHTDSNQHVNSLVYPRLFEERAVQRVPAVQSLLMRAFEIRWRRPFFLGERAQIVMRNESADGKPTVVGAFQGEGGKPSTTLKMCFG